MSSFEVAVDIHTLTLSTIVITLTHVYTMSLAKSVYNTVFKRNSV